MKSLRDAIRPTLNDAAGPGWRDGLTLLEQWHAIMGSELARLCAPAQVRFSGKEKRDGTLVLAAPGAARLELQHHSPLILNKVNAFFGYGAIARIQLVPGGLPGSPPAAAAPAQPEISLPEALKTLEKKLAGHTTAIERAKA